MNMFRKYFTGILVFIWLLLSIPALAQTAGNVEMADTLRADGKIYVVVAVVTVILIGVLVFLIMTDRKLSRLEKQMKA